ncbi:hypothetical protein Vadar_031313 [Vaccinium darrowii]|uniref:Uncharacterized protein n=1 Tax=Vaccinium darrowii TaxID=229202 RepID=A0ACB7YIH7_9ERIC|nr:hypothetical protein Vadar_031313 [Vaccinium darrowii]
MELAMRDMGLDASMIAAIHDMLDFSDDSLTSDRPHHCRPSRTFVRDNKAIKNTAADILEFPNSHVFILDMPGVKPDQIKVQVEDGNVLVVSGERRREKEREHKEGVKYVRMERRQGKFLKKFELPGDADLESIHANYQDGVLTITVEKKPKPEPKRPRTIEVKVGGSAQTQAAGGGGGGGQDAAFGDAKDRAFGEVIEQQPQQGGDQSSGAQGGEI